METRKRKKVYAGDLVAFNGQYFQIALKGATADYEFVESQPGEEQQPETKNEKNSENKSAKMNKTRKPITF